MLKRHRVVDWVVEWFCMLIWRILRYIKIPLSTKQVFIRSPLFFLAAQIFCSINKYRHFDTATENPPFWWCQPGKMMISHDYVLVYQMMHTVVGRNPAPVEVGRLSHYLQGFFSSFRWWSPDFWTIKSMISYCWWKRSCTTRNVSNPVNNGINYQPRLVSRISSINHSCTPAVLIIFVERLTNQSGSRWCPPNCWGGLAQHYGPQQNWWLTYQICLSKHKLKCI